MDVCISMNRTKHGAYFVHGISSLKPTLIASFTWLQRNHEKMYIAFVGMVCNGDDDAERGVTGH